MHPACPLSGRSYSSIMQSHLIDEASKKIKNTQILINVISRRVRQLSQGHRPLVDMPPGSGFSDTALTEVIQGKISFEETAEFRAEPITPRNSDFRGFTSHKAA